MASLNPSALLAMRASLVVLWCVTALVSVQQLHGRSEALLVAAGVPAGWHLCLVVGGAVLDAMIGVALWRWHQPMVYKLAVANLLVMTATATALLPSLWLDPLGSLTKNLPIAALLWVLHQDAQG